MMETSATCAYCSVAYSSPLCTAQFLCTLLEPGRNPVHSGFMPAARLEVWNMMMDLKGVAEFRDGVNGHLNPCENIYGI
jgi:hypothetical protein